MVFFKYLKYQFKLHKKLIIIVILTFLLNIYITYSIFKLKSNNQLNLNYNLEGNDNILLPSLFLFDIDNLTDVKKRINSNDSNLKNPCNYLIEEAENLLEVQSFSVTQKILLPPSNDKHDYYSILPYSWKNENGEYINKDGYVNPDILYYKDNYSLGTTATRSFKLALVYFFTDDEKYASKSADLLRKWFLDEKTKMNPNFNWALSTPNGQEGQGGSIEGMFLPLVIEADGLLTKSVSWTDVDHKNLVLWFNELLNWFLTSKIQLEDAESLNNHGTWNDILIADFSLFVGKKDLAKKILNEALIKRIEKQIEPEGKQTYEISRSKSLWYSVFNLRALFHLAELARHVNIDMFNYTSNDGRSLKKALDYLMPFIQGKKKWPYQQMSEEIWFVESQQEVNELLLEILQAAAIIYDDFSYADSLKFLGLKNQQYHISNLLYPSNKN